MKRSISLLLLTATCAFAQMDDVGFIASLAESAPTPPFDPTINSSLLARYDVNALGLNDGDLVSTVTDSGPLAFDLLSSGAARPYWTNNVALLNDKGYLVFDGTSDFVRVVFDSYAQPTTIFLVAKAASVPSGIKVWIDNGDNTTYQVVLHYDGTVGINAGTLVNVGGQVTTWQVWEIYFSGASSYMKYNAGTTVVAGNAGTQARKGITLGLGRNTADGFYMPIDIAFVSFYTNTLNATTISNINWFLQDRFGL